MSLPKRDGVHDRYYLIHKPDTSPEVLAEADLCIQDVLNGTARENHSAYPTVVRNHNGTPFLPDQLLERYLTGLPLKGFPCEDAVSLCDAMRRCYILRCPAAVGGLAGDPLYIGEIHRKAGTGAVLPCGRAG